MDNVPARELVERIDALLPQTQCRRCGYDGCRPYAEALVQGDAINRCPPGGDPLIVALAALTAQPIVPLDAVHGPSESLHVALIDEARCIGCTLCIQACPVDAIVGAARQMHTVLTALCTGCELCVPPCPVDCIDITPAGRAWSAEDARAARARYAARNARLVHGDGDGQPRALQSRGLADPVPAVDMSQQHRREEVAAARSRARARRARESEKLRSP
jgi:electron transport complex protein RnfB